MLDLCYEEDSSAEVDCNIVRNGVSEFIEVQGTGEGGTFTRGELQGLLDLAEKGLDELQEIQRKSLELTSEEEVAFGTGNGSSCQPKQA